MDSPINDEEKKKKVRDIAIKRIADKYGRELSEDNMTGGGVTINDDRLGMVTFFERRGDQEIWKYHIKVDITTGNVIDDRYVGPIAHEKGFTLPDEFYAKVLGIEEKKDKYGKPAIFMRIRLPNGEINTQKYLGEHIHKLLIPAMKKLGLEDTTNFIGNTYKFIKKETSPHSKVRWIPDQEELND